MSIIETYPDNPKRKARAEELQTDCSNYLNDLIKAGKEFDELIGKYNQQTKEALIDIYGDPHDPRIKSEKVEIDTGVSMEVAKHLAAIVTSLIAEETVTFALRTWIVQGLQNVTLQAGQQVLMLPGSRVINITSSQAEVLIEGGIQEFASKNLKLPLWTRVTSRAGGIGAGIVVTIAVETLLEGIWTGPEAREKFRVAIKKSYGSRKKIKNAVLSTQYAVNTIRENIAILDFITKYPKTEADLNNYFKDQVDKCRNLFTQEKKKELCQQAEAELNDLDTRRGSYTDEDGVIEAECKEDCCWEKILSTTTGINKLPIKVAEEIKWMAWNAAWYAANTNWGNFLPNSPEKNKCKEDAVTNEKNFKKHSENMRKAAIELELNLSPNALDNIKWGASNAAWYAANTRVGLKNEAENDKNQFEQHFQSLEDTKLVTKELAGNIKKMCIFAAWHTANECADIIPNKETPGMLSGPPQRKPSRYKQDAENDLKQFEFYYSQIVE